MKMDISEVEKYGNDLYTESTVASEPAKKKNQSDSVSFGSPNNGIVNCQALLSILLLAALLISKFFFSDFYEQIKGEYYNSKKTITEWDSTEIEEAFRNFIPGLGDENG